MNTVEMNARLLQICEQAQEAAKESGDVSGADRWADRAKQVRDGRVFDKGFVVWLKCSADYWGPKDRAYADSLVQLAKTCR